MEYRYLGRSGLQISALSLGSWVTYGGLVGEEIALECAEKLTSDTMERIETILGNKPEAEPDYH